MYFRRMTGLHDQPIISSLIDLDFYKNTMGQNVFHRHPDVQVVYGLTNRTKDVPLCRFINIDQLREELEHVRTLRPTKSEMHYLLGTDEYGDRMFRKDYLTFFEKLQLPEFDIGILPDMHLRLEFSGKWSEAIYWETIALAIVNELYFRAVTKDYSQFALEALYAEGVRRLYDKIQLLRKYPGITFSEFGTRRRFSFPWQRYVTEVLANELPKEQFLGTSNTLLAMQLGLLPMGTNAHEEDMVYAALAGDDDTRLRASHNQLLRDWWSEYGWGLSIALTDTFGSEFFFSDMTQAQAAEWKGLRHDSGDPFAFGEAAIKFYERHGITPKDKLIVFSDGLELPAIIKLYEQFAGRIRTTFGWGTNLSNDLGLRTLSLVIKVIKANGRPCVKLSDNLAKAIGPEGEVARYKRVFGHTVTEYVECVR